MTRFAVAFSLLLAFAACETPYVAEQRDLCTAACEDFKIDCDLEEDYIDCEDSCELHGTADCADCYRCLEDYEACGTFACPEAPCCNACDDCL